MDNSDWFYVDGSDDVPCERQVLDELVNSGTISEDTPIGWYGMRGRAFPAKYRNATFFWVAKSGFTESAYSSDELDQAVVTGRLLPSVVVYGPRLPVEGVPQENVRSKILQFDPTVERFLARRSSAPYTVVSGANNSGKTVLLKELRRDIGPRACMLSANRFYHLDAVAYATSREQHYVQRHSAFVQQLYANGHNQEVSDVQLQQLIGWMSDAQRERLLSIASELLGERFLLKQVDETNKLSPHYIEVGGSPLSHASSGTRLVLGILAACVDDGSDTLLVDEPEIGLSPALQRQLARYE